MPVRILRNAQGADKRPAADWPDWVDDHTWELGPDPEDARWAAENLNADGPAPGDPIWDRWAEEAKAVERHERGLRMY
jgi:hypothetical protein